MQTLERLCTKYAPFWTHRCYLIDICSDATCTTVSGTTQRHPRNAVSALFSLLPPRMHPKMVSIRTLFDGRERRVPTVQIRYVTRNDVVGACGSLSRSKRSSQTYNTSQAEHAGHCWNVLCESGSQSGRTMQNASREDHEESQSLMTMQNASQGGPWGKPVTKDHEESQSGRTMKKRQHYIKHVFFIIKRFVYPF